MASTKVVPLDWAEKLRFNVSQAKLSAVTGNFNYFHASRAQYIANGVDYVATLQAENIDEAEAIKISTINATSAETNETAVAELERELKATKIDTTLPQAAQELEWVKRINERNEACKQTVIDRMDSATKEAINLIHKLPKESQDAAANFYDKGLQLVVQCFEVMAKYVEELLNHVVDFIRGVWTAVVGAYNAVKNYVGGAVETIMGWFGGFFASAQSNGIIDVDASDASQATQFLLSLVYSFRIPHNEVVASTNRIWDEYQAQYSEATTKQEPQSVTVSRKPRPEGDRDTDGKLMFISWQADGAGSSSGRELMEPVCQSEQKALAGSYSGGLRYNIVDMGNPPKAKQQKQGMGSKQGIQLQSRRREVRH